jgi:hypothetical protein
LLPSLDALVAAGGQSEGAIVVHQEDNAGNSLLSVPLMYTMHQSKTLTLSQNVYL